MTLTQRHINKVRKRLRRDVNQKDLAFLPFPTWKTMLPPEPIELPVEIPMEPLSIFLPVLTVEAKPVEIDTSPVT